MRLHEPIYAFISITHLKYFFLKTFRFFQKPTLKAHILGHSNPTRFKCPYENCGKAFSLGHHLKSHIKIHTGNINCIVFYLHVKFSLPKTMNQKLVKNEEIKSFDLY